MYIEFTREYLAMDHIERVLASKVRGKPYYYLMQLGLLRLSSLTTKLCISSSTQKKKKRIWLFTKRGPYDCGPKLQPDLFNIMVKFRMYVVTFTANI